MAQEVRLQGRTYSDVPSILLPDSNNVFHPFTDVSDTTATAADVATGKYFYLADGTKTQGTSSGGGASNIVMGTFTTGSTRGSGTGTFTINYTGTGYPIALLVFISGGAYNNTSGGNTTWYNSTNRYDAGIYYMTKSQRNVTPTYSSTTGKDYGCAVVVYKNSTSNSTTYSRTSSMAATTYSNSSTNRRAAANCCIFKGNGKTVSYYVGNLSASTIGLVPNTEYQYIAVYSS